MKIENVKELVANLHDKTEYVIHIRNKAWLNLYIDMNTDLRQKAENYFEKYFFKLMNNAVFWKNYGKCEKA